MPEPTPAPPTTWRQLVVPILLALLVLLVGLVGYQYGWMAGWQERSTHCLTPR